MSALEIQTVRSPCLAWEELECPPTRLNVCAREFAGTPEQQVHPLHLNLLGLTELPFGLPAMSAGLAPSGSCSPHKRQEGRWWRGPSSFLQQSVALQPELLHLHVPLRAHTDIYSYFQRCTFILDKTSKQRPTLSAGLAQPCGHPGPPRTMALHLPALLRSHRASALCHRPEHQPWPLLTRLPLQAGAEALSPQG